MIDSHSSFYTLSVVVSVSVTGTSLFQNRPLIFDIWQPPHNVILSQFFVSGSVVVTTQTFLLNGQ